MSGSIKHYTGETEDDQMLSQWVGIELILSAADVEQSPDQAYAKWKNEVSPLRSEHG
ncbi:hypothetical protein QMT40_001494 [Parvibaculaceae bacterium PLY_AMNH_Bact1]|nr:hypothetical protein QMT40_001494 [Parvibaculaceae bacterium PLY_AMNH_Bact1]